MGENAGLFTATVVLIPAVLIALVVSYVQLRRLPVMPLVTAILVVIFGALTLYFQDPRFIKMKPTFLYAIFGLALLGGLYLKKTDPRNRPRQCDAVDGRRLAYSHLALGRVLSGACDPQRDHLAHAIQQCLGRVQIPPAL